MFGFGRNDRYLMLTELTDIPGTGDASYSVTNDDYLLGIHTFQAAFFFRDN
jgi:hypothetical protein